MAQEEISLQYKVSVASITKHLFEVELVIPETESTSLTLELPAWIPGSYMIRDFAKNIVYVTAENSHGESIPFEKQDKQTWLIHNDKQATTVTYQVYAYDMSVRAAFLDKQIGFFNGTSLFLRVKELKDSPCEVRVRPVESLPTWNLYTAMAKKSVRTTGFGLYKANNYLDLIEHPMLMAAADSISFEYQDIEYEMVFAGGHDADLHRIKQDLQKVVEHHYRFFEKKLDLDYYLFITLLTENSFGGLEHTDSTALMYSRQDLPTVAQADEMPEGYITFLSLCSHEFFHTWHVKRTRPLCFMDPDLSQEVYTEQLWIYEGFTSYYDDFSLLRCGLIEKQDYLKILGQQLTRLHRNPGRHIQTVTDSSFDAWSKFYKQDENATNSIVSYYNKGAIVALCLDLKIRIESRGTYSLDSVLRFLWKHYGQKQAGTDDKVIHHILDDAMGLNLSEFLDCMLYETKELPITELLEEFGVNINYRARANASDKGGTPSEKVATRDFGAQYTQNQEGMLINQVINGGAAQLAGLEKGDLIIAFNRLKLGTTKIETLLQREAPHSAAKLNIFRRGRLIELSLPILLAREDTIYLTVADEDKAASWLQVK